MVCTCTVHTFHHEGETAGYDGSGSSRGGYLTAGGGSGFFSLDSGSFMQKCINVKGHMHPHLLCRVHRACGVSPRRRAYERVVSYC